MKMNNLDYPFWLVHGPDYDVSKTIDEVFRRKPTETTEIEQIATYHGCTVTWMKGAVEP